MKTLYVLAPDATRLGILTEKTEEVKRAERVVLGIADVESGWLPTIELPVDDRPLKNSLLETKFRVSAVNVEGRVESYVDIGYEGTDGWNSMLDSENFSALPDVWFSSGFLDLFEPKVKGGHPRSPVLKSHRGAFLDQFWSYVDDELKYDESRESDRIPGSLVHQTIIREIGFYKGVLSLITDVKEDKLPQTILEEVWAGRYELWEADSKPSRVSPGKERE